MYIYIPRASLFYSKRKRKNGDEEGTHQSSLGRWMDGDDDDDDDDDDLRGGFSGRQGRREGMGRRGQARGEKRGAFPARISWRESP